MTVNFSEPFTKRTCSAVLTVTTVNSYTLLTDGDPGTVTKAVDDDWSQMAHWVGSLYLSMQAFLPSSSYLPVT